MRVKTEERRRAILEIAKTLFTTRGFAQTSMSEIAKKMGGSKATLYNYFSSKEEIFAVVMELAAAQDLAGAFHIFSTKMPVNEVLLKFGTTYMKSVLTPEITAVLKMAYMESDRSSIGRYFYENGPKKGWLRVQEYLALQVENKQLRLCDTWIAAMQLKALMEAELLHPYMLGVIEKPTETEIRAAVERAVQSFGRLYYIQ